MPNRSATEGRLRTWSGAVAATKPPIDLAQRPPKVKQESRIALAVALVVSGFLIACQERAPKYERIVLPDAVFVVPWDLLSPGVRVGGERPYAIEIPCNQVPQECAISEVSRGMVGGMKHRIEFDARPTPIAGQELAHLQRHPGWSLLPDAANAEYRVLEYRGQQQPAPERNQRVYELKADPRYVISCTEYTTPTASVACGMYVPYREFSGERCVQFRITFDGKDMSDWRELANRRRALLRRFEDKSN